MTDSPEVPSDVVELIIAVDLNPSDPEEPINVNSVDVRGKGEDGEGGDDWRGLVVQLLMGDPESGVQSDSISYDEAVQAVSRVLEGPEATEDPFSKFSSRGDAPAPSGTPSEKRPGSMQSALESVLGTDKEDEEY